MLTSTGPQLGSCPGKREGREDWAELEGGRTIFRNQKSLRKPRVDPVGGNKTFREKGLEIRREVFRSPGRQGLGKLVRPLEGEGL